MFDICFLRFFALCRCFAEEDICRRGERNAEEHSDRACDSSADGYCRKNPHSRQIDAATHNLRVDDVSFKLLENDEKNDEDNRFYRVNCQNHKRSDNCADECTDDGDKSRDADERADHRGIGNSENEHTDHTKRSEDYCIESLTEDEIAEVLADDGAGVEGPSSALFGNPDADEADYLFLQFFFSEKDIDGENDCDEEIENATDDAADCSDRSVHDVSALIFKPILHRCEKLIPLDLKKKVSERASGKLLLTHCAYGVDKIYRAVKNDLECLDKLRNKERDDARDDSENEDERNNERNRAAKLLDKRLLRFFEKMRLKKPHRDIENKREDKAENERHNEIHRPRNRGRDYVDILDSEKNEYAGGNDADYPF